VDEAFSELISRMASRIYNEKPQEAAASSAMPSFGEVPTAPDAVLPHASGLQARMAGVPPVAPHLPSADGTGGAPSFDTPRAAVATPQFAHWPHGGLPAEPAANSFAPSLPEGAAAPGPFANPPVPSDSSAGIAAFVAQIRQTHVPNRESWVQRNGHSGPQPHVLRHVGESPTSRAFDVPAIREDFPILRQSINGKPLAWMDNAATTQKPQSVIDAISHFYSTDYSNIHRGAHSLAARATDAYEKAREKIQSFLGASSSKEIVFVRGTTEGINLVANTYGRKFLQPGDEIVLSMLEHHAQIVPWQMVAKDKGANLRVIPVNDHGEVMLEEYQKLLGPRTKVVALTQASNSLGTILPVEEMTQMAKRYGARVIIDGAQSVAHIPVNLQQMGADFFVFSGHKIFGPTGIGAVFIKEELHDVLPPWQGGGNMIRNVTFEETTFSEAPARFEAGTPSITDAVGLRAALDYVSRIGLPNIAAYEHKLLEYATEELCRISGVRVVGTAREKVSVLSFVLPNRRTEEVGRLLNEEGIAVRAGHHCSQPSLRRFGLESTVRPSFSLYNTHDEIDRLVDAVRRIQRMP
jgi:cysteine desulfurase/selenocysteine lyase